MTIKIDWISVQDELPPCDGTYCITNDPSNASDYGIANYDGYGFVQISAYLLAQYWSYYKKPEKKYGKVNKNDSAI